MAFILRVKADCSDSEMSSKLISGLSTMASLQDIHPGVICYHFSRPEPDTKPNHFEFTEVYGSEGAFFGHSSDPKFIETYGSLFPSDKITSSTWGYGPMSEQVKGICVTFLKCRFPKETAGPILANQSFDWESSYESSAKDGSVLLVAQLQAKPGKAKDVLEKISKLSSEANKGVVVCFASVPEEEKEPNMIEFIEVCTTNSHLVSHFTSDSGKPILKAIQEETTSMTWRGYGKLVHEAVQSLAEVGVQVVARGTDTGYVLHSKADPAGQ